MAKRITKTAGKKTPDQRAAYHQAALKRIELDRQIQALKAQKKSLK